MLKDITLGQYFPGSSPLHRLDPRTKIILTIAYIVGVFLADSVSAFIAVTAFTAALVLISRIPMRTVIVGMKPLIFIIAFTVIVNVFWAKGEHPLFEWGIIHIYAEGLMTALLVTLRIAALLTGTSIILTYTTSPTALTDGLERLLAPLARLHVPVHDFAMMMTIALRFIPTLIEETDKIMNAQRARGVDFSHGNLIERAKALIPVLIPLFLSAIRRASDLATAMECRCYRGGEGRTRMQTTRIGAGDVASLLIMAAFCAAVVLLGRFCPIYTSTVL